MNNTTSFLKTAVLIHDLSGVGRCSLTVALPILSAMGVTGACLPTAYLSTHTGGFTDYFFRDLTEDMEKVFAHWEKENLSFDGVYTGYIATKKQTEIILNILKSIKQKGGLTVVDPVLGDHGKLYSGLSKDMVEGMKSLIPYADVITPNYTEASLLLDIPYKNTYNRCELKEMIEGFQRLGAKDIVLTGYEETKGQVGALCYSKGETKAFVLDHVPAHFDGTGDVFTSVLTGALLNHKSVFEGAEIAVSFTHDAVLQTFLHHGNEHFGVDFETLLYTLKERLEKKHDQV